VRQNSPHSPSSPPVHPASWGSQPRHSGGGVSPIPLGRHRHSTHHPPHEQLLVRLEAGGVLFVGAAVVVVGVMSSWRVLVAAARRPARRRSSPPRAVSPPRCVGVGGVSPCGRGSSSSSLFHPQSTPRAVAREIGGRWCVMSSSWGLGAGGPGRLSALVVLLSCGMYSHSTPRSTPRAAARDSGGGCCHRRRRSTCDPPMSSRS
jgi:hypothetical protein